MDWDALYLIALGVGLLLTLVVFGYAAIMRMSGRRSRFERFVEMIVRGQGAAIYPPSLRPDPSPAVVESEEAGRGANATHEAAGASAPTRTPE